MRIFVTGASGYIGTELCRRLAADGHRLIALVRPTSEIGELEALGVARFEGDVTDRYSMREAMSGADWVVHTAAVIDFTAGGELMRRVNVEGSENVASLAYKLGVGRVLNLASIAAFGGSPDDGSPANEESPPRLPFPNAYSATKHAGVAAFAGWAQRGLKVNTVYPGFVYGRPARKNGANALLRNLAKGRTPALVGADRITRWIHVADLVEGIVRVMERAEPGAGYLMSGSPATIEELAGRVSELAGVRRPNRRLSPAAARVVMALVGPLFRLRGRRPPLVAAEIRGLARHWNFDDARARRELDWHPRTLDDGLPDTVRHLLSL